MPAEFRRSGVSAHAFARPNSLPYTTRVQWLKKSGPAPRPVSFTEVSLAAPPPEPLVLELGPHARLRLTSSSHIPPGRRTHSTPPGLMLAFHSHLKVFPATAPCDLRASFNGLWAAAQNQLGEDPKSGALFLFTNRRHNRIKILFFDGTGVCVLIEEA